MLIGRGGTLEPPLATDANASGREETLAFIRRVLFTTVISDNHHRAYRQRCLTYLRSSA